MTFDPQEGYEMLHGSAAIRPRESVENEAAHQPSAIVIINADDWGRDTVTTDRTLDCHVHRAISSVSAMVFMEDSERAASLAREHGVDTGLHLNFTAPFTAPQCSALLLKHQQKISRFLNSHQYARFFFHPGLASSFDYVVHTQLEEFQRLYGAPANRVDGHHHMHLCQNVQFQNLLPAGSTVRKNFTYIAGEIGFLTQSLRRWEDRRLTRHYRVTDFFFDLSDLLPLAQRPTLERILDLARCFNVEVETHPASIREYRFLMDGEIHFYNKEVDVARGFTLRPGNSNGSTEGCQ